MSRSAWDLTKLLASIISCGIIAHSFKCTDFLFHLTSLCSCTMGTINHLCSFLGLQLACSTSYCAMLLSGTEQEQDLRAFKLQLSNFIS